MGGLLLEWLLWCRLGNAGHVIGRGIEHEQSAWTAGEAQTVGVEHISLAPGRRGLPQQFGSGRLSEVARWSVLVNAGLFEFTGTRAQVHYRYRSLLLRLANGSVDR